MRAAILALGVALGGCQLIAGIEDPVGDACSPFDIDTCDITDTCDGDPDVGRLTCRMEGTVPAGGLCFERDDCAGPLSCVDGVCRTFCPVYGEACAGPEAECLRDWFGLNVCDSACDVLDNTGCSTDTECVISTNGNGVPIALCVPFGYFGAVAPGDPCTFLSECTPGYACFDPEGNGGTCTPLCTVGELCPDTSQCVELFAPLHGVAIGQCPI